MNNESHEKELPPGDDFEKKDDSQKSSEAK